MNRRPLSTQEAALWRKLIQTVEPLDKQMSRAGQTAQTGHMSRPGHVSPAPSVVPTKTAQPLMEKRKQAEVFPPEKQMFADLLDGKKKRSDHTKTALSQTKTVPQRPVEKGGQGGLDGHWQRRLGKGAVEPEMTIDLHGHSLASAYTRMDTALAEAQTRKVRVMLLITGKARAGAAGAVGPDGRPRGAIRAAMQDWLTASRHAANIAAVRNAHPRHGGAGALYVIMKRPR